MLNKQVCGSLTSTALKYILSILFLAAVLAVVFYEPLFKNFGALQWDAREVHLYNLIFSSRVWHQGILPFWNSYLYSGWPQFADPQVAIFYPVNFLIGLFAVFTPRILMMQIIFHYFLAGVFMFLLVRYLTKSHLAGIFSGAVYMLSGFMIGHASHVGMQNTAAWLPLLMLFLLLTLESGRSTAFGTSRVIFAAMLGLFLSFAFLAGHFQTFLYSFFFLGLIFIYKIIVGRRELINPKTLKLMGAAAGVFLLLIAVQFLPTYQLTAQSARAKISLELSQTESLAPQSFWALIKPNYNNAAFGGYRGPWDRTQNYLYIGLSTLILAGVGLFLARKKFAYFLGGAAILAAAYSLGKYFYVQPFFYKLVPFFDKIRAPSNMMLLAEFAIILLAGFGLAWVLDKKAHQAVSKKRYVVGFLAVAVVVFELVVVVKANTLLYTRDYSESVVAAPDIVKNIAQEYQGLDKNSSFSAFRLNEIGVDRNFTPIFDIYAADGYNPLALGRQEKFIDAMVKNANLVDLSGIKYLPCQYIPERAAALEKIGQLCVNEKYLPQAFFVDDFIFARDETEALNKLGRVNLSETVVVEKALPAGFNIGGEDAVGGTSDRRVEIIEAESGHWKIKVENNDDGFLFLRQTFYPGWQAKVNGVGIEIYRADYLFSAIPLKAGVNDIILDFQPKVFWAGAGMSLAGILSVFLLGAYAIIKRDKNKK